MDEIGHLILSGVRKSLIFRIALSHFAHVLSKICGSVGGRRLPQYEVRLRQASFLLFDRVGVRPFYVMEFVVGRVLVGLVVEFLLVGGLILAIVYRRRRNSALEFEELTSAVG